MLTAAAAGVSALRSGLLPLSQEALICGHVSYHDYAGILVDDAMRKQIVQDLGPRYKILVLRNHGAAFCGATIEEAYFWLMTFMTAVDIQLRAMSAAGGRDGLVLPEPHVLDKVQKVIEVGVNEKPQDGVEWRLGEMEYEAEMRRMDAMVGLGRHHSIRLFTVLVILCDRHSFRSYYTYFYSLQGYKTGYEYKKSPALATTTQ